jgi:hypothetical protein
MSVLIVTHPVTHGWYPDGTASVSAWSSLYGLPVVPIGRWVVEI